MTITTEAAHEAYDRLGSKAAVARELGCSERTVGRKLQQTFNDPESVIHRNCQEQGIDPDDVRYAWIKTDGVSMFVRRQDIPSYEELRDEFIEEMKSYAPVYEKINYKGGDHLLVVDAADVHIGKYSRIFETGYDYDMQEAVRRVRHGVANLANKAKVFGISKILFIIGNDILHVDGPKNTTTGDTRQDVNGLWYEMFMEAKKVYIASIEELSQIAEVHVVHAPSNHDRVLGSMLADNIYSWFRNNPNVHFGEDNRSISIAHRKYVVYGSNLIGISHGDGAKEKDLPNLMQYEAREAWGKTKYAYLYLHHFHHKIRNVSGLDSQKKEKDHIGVTVLESGKTLDPTNNVYIEYIRSPSPPDSWHSTKGYVNEQAIEVFLHHLDKGQVARFTEYF